MIIWPCVVTRRWEALMTFVALPKANFQQPFSIFKLFLKSWTSKRGANSSCQFTDTQWRLVQNIPQPFPNGHAPWISLESLQSVGLSQSILSEQPPRWMRDDLWINWALQTIPHRSVLLASIQIDLWSTHTNIVGCCLPCIKYLYSTRLEGPGHSWWAVWLILCTTCQPALQFMYSALWIGGGESKKGRVCACARACVCVLLRDVMGRNHAIYQVQCASLFHAPEVKHELNNLSFHSSTFSSSC